MELWVRSQDKEKLVKVNDIYISKYGKTNVVFLMSETSEKDETNIFANCDEWLGKYKTKERALEVLDEIQRFITKLDIEGNRYYQYDVYEMPEE